MTASSDPIELPILTPSGRTLTALVTGPAPVSGVAANGCAVIQIHGGGWELGAPATLARRSRELAGHGFTAIAVEYRLTGEAPWPAQLHDVKRAIRHVRANAASLGIDPDLIVLEGHSAGGHLALMAAGTADHPEWDETDPGAGSGSSPGLGTGSAGGDGVSCSVAAVVAFYPPTDLRQGPSSVRLLGPNPDPAVAAGASPIVHVRAGFPPTMLLHGTDDAVVPVSSSETFHRALVEAGVASELHLYAGQIHEFDAGATFCALTQHEAAVFFERHLLDSDRYQAEQAADNPLWGR